MSLFNGPSLTFQDYLKVINSASRLPRIRVELLYKIPTGYEVYEEITSDISATSGSLTINNANGKRRSASLTLNDFKRKYKISPDSLWIDTYIRIYKGFEIGTGVYEFLNGTFVLEDPSVLSNLTNRTIELTCTDKMALYEHDLEAIYQIPNGSSLKSAIIAIQNEVGDPCPLIFDSALEGLTTPYTISRSDSYKGIFDELANLYSSNYYFDVFGNLHFESGKEQIDDSLKPSQYHFNKDGSDPNYINGSVKYSISKVKNHVVVIGATVEGTIYDATASDTNLSSPVCIDRIGKRTLKIDDDNINTEQFAQDRANYELKKSRVMYCECSISCLPLPHLDVNQVIEVTDEDLNFVQQRLLIQSIQDNYTVDGMMSISASNVNEISFN